MLTAARWRLAQADFERYDALLAMDRTHWMVLQQRYLPSLQPRLGLLLEFAGLGAGREVPDPYYGTLEDFRQVRSLLEQGVDALISRLRSWLGVLAGAAMRGRRVKTDRGSVMRWGGYFGLWLAVGWAGPVLAGEPAQQASMVLTGDIQVGADGRVASYQLDHQNQVQSDVRQLLAATIARWRFAPGPAQAPMQVRVLARQREDGRFALRVEGVSFGDRKAQTALRYQWQHPQPVYPLNLLRARVGGQVQVLVDVGVDGHVLHAMAEQVDLFRAALPGQMRVWQLALARVSVRAIADWTFATPPPEQRRGATHWYAVVPVRFDINPPGALSAAPPGYGQWQWYYPGQRSLPDWYRPAPGQRIPDVVPQGSLAGLQSSLKLLTSPQGG